MDRILVTGACGFIGSHIVEYLSKIGYRVRATDLDSADFSIARSVGAEIVPSDLFDRESLKKAVKDVKYIIHTAALFDLGAPRDILERVNVEGVENLCEVSLSEDIKRFVQFSTVAIYGRPKSLPCQEESPKRPKDDYGRTKWQGEKKAFSYYEKHSFPVTALRPTLVYGPRSRYGYANFIAGAVLLKWRGKASIRTVEGGPITHHVHVIDVCRAVHILIEEGGVIGRAFNVADARPLSIEETLLAIIEPIGMSIRKRIKYYPWLWKSLVYILLLILPVMIKRLNHRIATRWRLLTESYGLVPALQPKVDKPWISYVLRDQYFDTSRLTNLGWSPLYPDFRKGIKETIQWYRNHRWIP